MLRETKICFARVRPCAQPSLQHALKPSARIFTSACDIDGQHVAPVLEGREMHISQWSTFENVALKIEEKLGETLPRE